MSVHMTPRALQKRCRSAGVRLKNVLCTLHVLLQRERWFQFALPVCYWTRPQLLLKANQNE